MRHEARAAGLPVGVLAAVAIAFGAAPAPASPGHLRLVSVDTSRLPLVAMTVAVPSGQDHRPPSFQLRENGQHVSGLHVGSAARGVDVVVAIDSSRSMNGAPLLSAVQAATSFVDAKRPTDAVEVVSFGSQAQVLSDLSADAPTSDTALGQIGVSPHNGTALYDAVVQGSDDLKSAGNGLHVLVVLTDGTDAGSKASIDTAIAAARDADVAIYAIGLRSHQFTPSALRTMTAATGGRLFASDRSAAGIRSVYASINDAIRSTYRLEYASAAASSPVHVALSAGGYQPLTSVYKAVNLTGRTPIVHASDAVSRFAQKPWSPLALAGAVGLVLLLGTLFVMRPRSEAIVAKRIEMYTTVQQRVPEQTSRVPAVRQLVMATERTLGRLSYFRHIAYLLEQSDLPLRAAELFYIQAAVSLVLALIASALAGTAGALVGLPVGAIAPYMFVRIKASKRRKAFEMQLPDTLVSIAASLRAGHSFAQSVSTVVKEGDDPAAKEFGRVESETRLGRPTDQAMESMAKRLGSENFEFVVLSVNIQRQVGGSLAEILDMVADTVRSREQFARKVKALTAMGRASAYVLIAMPFFLACMIWLLNPAYIAPLFDTGTGLVLILIGLVSITFGTLVMRKIVNFKY